MLAVDPSTPPGGDTPRTWRDAPPPAGWMYAAPALACPACEDVGTSTPLAVVSVVVTGGRYGVIWRTVCPVCRARVDVAGGEE